MKLYYSKGACSLAINIILHELNLPCEFIAVSLKNHTLEKTGEDFYKINPKGAVPSLRLEDGTILTENAVIQQYLVDTHKIEPTFECIENFNNLSVDEKYIVQKLKSRYENEII